MEQESDSQKRKRSAADSYDYERDPRWSEFWSNVNPQPPMLPSPSPSDVIIYYKRKFYQRYIDPDLVVEPMNSTRSSQSAMPSLIPTPVSENARPHATSATGTYHVLGRNSLRLDRRTIQFSLNAWVLVLAVLGVLPVASKALSNKAYRLSFLGTGLSSFYSLCTHHGTPRAWNLPSLHTWFMSMVAAKDFIHFIYSLVLVSSKIHLKFALIPVLCWALEYVAIFLRHNFSRSLFYRRYFEETCVWVERNITTLGLLSSNAEITLGFLMIISLFSWQGNILRTFMYWQLLKLMYHARATAGYHKVVWAQINRTISPYIYRYAPFMNTPLSSIQRWWFM